MLFEVSINATARKIMRTAMRLAQTNQDEMQRKSCTGHERGRLGVAGIFMKVRFSIAAPVVVLSVGAIAGQVTGPTRLPNGDLIVSYSGTPGRIYVAEWANIL